MSTIALPEPDRAAGLAQLERFATKAGRDYASRRNFDLGPENRGNVSTLSPFVRHRLVLEQEILQSTLALHTPSQAAKFVEEVFWRAYFKGWLEHRPSVWSDYRVSIRRLIDDLDSDADLHARYESAIAGNTGIDCFDAWARELVQTGYLHNHARMWFASIWVFTLQLPWQLGADFFYRHLLDGDPASNTLSWRWVCGLHTRGKTYLARVSNIASYTDNRFNPHGQLAVTAPPLTEDRSHPLIPLPAAQTAPVGERFGLLVTEEDCLPETLGLSEPPQSVIAALTTNARSLLPVGVPARQFAIGAVADALDRTCQHFAVEGEHAPNDNWGTALAEWALRHELRTIVTAYAPVGPVAEQLVKATEHLDTLGIRILQVRRDYDSQAWPHATKGYFRLKSKIPEMLQRLQLVTDEEDRLAG